MKILHRFFCVVAATLLSSVVQAASISGQGTWETTLHARDLTGDGSADAYYDEDLTITWLRDANYPLTSSYPIIDDQGRMAWNGGNGWAAGLVINGFDDWRLPAVSPNEMDHMFKVTLGNIYDGSPGSSLTNMGPFVNIVADSTWYFTNHINHLNNASVVHPNTGVTSATSLSALHFSWAVHPGDIGTPVSGVIPVPAALWLFGSGLLGIIGISGSRKVR